MWPQIYAVYKMFGASAVRRMLTPPEKWVRKTAVANGADPDEAVRQRNQAVEETVEFLESMVDPDFEDLE